MEALLMKSPRIYIHNLGTYINMLKTKNKSIEAIYSSKILSMDLLIHGSCCLVDTNKAYILFWVNTWLTISYYCKSTCGWYIVSLTHAFIVYTVKVAGLIPEWKGQNFFNRKSSKKASNILNILERSNSRQEVVPYTTNSNNY